MIKEGVEGTDSVVTNDRVLMSKEVWLRGVMKGSEKTLRNGIYRLELNLCCKNAFMYIEKSNFPEYQQKTKKRNLQRKAIQNLNYEN